MPDPVINVQDTLNERSGIITNVLLAAAVALLGWMNLSITELNTHVAVMQEVNNRQSDDIKKLQRWRESIVDFREIRKRTRRDPE